MFVVARTALQALSDKADREESGAAAAAESSRREAEAKAKEESDLVRACQVRTFVFFCCTLLYFAVFCCSLLLLSSFFVFCRLLLSLYSPHRSRHPSTPYKLIEWETQKCARMQSTYSCSVSSSLFDNLISKIVQVCGEKTVVAKNSARNANRQRAARTLLEAPHVQTEKNTNKLIRPT